MKPAPLRFKRAFALVAMILLLVVGFARLLIVVSHRPMFGFANNYDFIKISSTVGLWVDEPGVDIYENHPSAPRRQYRSHGVRELERRYLSSELLVVFAAIAVADVWNWIIGNPPHRFDLRILGITKLFMFLAAGVGLSFLFLRHSSPLGVISALIFAVLICDPMNSLYFNTLYFEDATVLFSYLAIGLGIYLLLIRSAGGWLLGAFCVVMFLASLSKMQHAGLALAIAGTFFVARLCAYRVERMRDAARWCAPMLLTALLSLWLGVVNNRSPSLRSMVFAAATDSWFGMALPAMENPTETLHSLKMPAVCNELIGKTWYSPDIHPHRCPQLLGLTRFQMVWALVRQPAAVKRILSTAIPLTRPFTPYYGEIEGQNFGKVQNAGIAFASVATVFAELSVPIYASLFVLSLAGAFFAILSLLTGERRPFASLSLFVTAVWTSSFLVALLGDGYVDLARHFHIGQNALVLASVSSFVVATRGVQRVIGALAISTWQ